MKSIRQLNQKKITLTELEHFTKLQTYGDLYTYVKQQIDEGVITPIKNSQLNGKKPALYNAYRVISQQIDGTSYQEEMDYGLNGQLDLGYYKKNIKQYEIDRKAIGVLSRFLTEEQTKLKGSVSMNERSFEIWGREKFLKHEGGRRLLKNLGIGIELFNVYETAEPIAYYAHHKEAPQNVLIIENMDTFYSMRRFMLAGNNQLLGKSIGTLIYGGGKGIIKSFKDFHVSVEPYLLNKENQFFYFGDLDYEGIGIYETLKEGFHKNQEIRPFEVAYLAMLRKGRIKKSPLPFMKEGQNKHLKGSFMAYFDKGVQEEMNRLLEENQYIPQEILSNKDFNEKIES